MYVLKKTTLNPVQLSVVVFVDDAVHEMFPEKKTTAAIHTSARPWRFWPRILRRALHELPHGHGGVLARGQLEFHDDTLL